MKAISRQKQDRIVSIDTLRGLAIFGMILCANIGWGSGLPAWMFHAQVPPPDYVFRPDVPGITWVDLVFPFFLFSMGAAFPFALSRRIESGNTWLELAGFLLKRWAILFVFSIVLGNSYRVVSSERPEFAEDLFMIAVWGALFLSLCRFRTGNRFLDRWAGIIGTALIAAAAFVMQMYFGVDVSKDSSNIIIMVLSYVSIAGGAVWLATRNSIKARWGIFLAILCIKAAASYWPEALSFAALPDWTGWFFRYAFLQYILIAIPGSIAGDMIMSAKNKTGSISTSSASSIRDIAAVMTAAASIVFQLWALFTRHVTADIVASTAAAAVFTALTFRDRTLWRDIALTGFILLIAGIVFDPLDGGIKKDPCNISYILTTSGMAALATSVFIYLETVYGARSRLLAQCGQNPMIAYTVTTFITLPVLRLTGILPVLDAWTVGNQAAGVIRGLVITGIMMAVTIFFTRKKLFWRS